MEALLFGSAARGTSDPRSDYDVLVSFETTDRVDREQVKLDIEARIGRSVGLSIYGMNRLRAMWSEGSPFAWHLYLEAKPILGFDFGLLHSLGQPKRYLDAAVDSQMMAGLLVSVADRARAKVSSICYEAGLLYVCTRNIAMFASWPLLGNFDFSRTAPFSISSKLPFPLGGSEYDVLISARHASTRGIDPPQISSESLIEWSSKLVEWAADVVGLLSVKRRN